MTPCPICNSPDALSLGFLGGREWLRCVACGMDFSRAITAEEQAVLDADLAYEVEMEEAMSR